jgi:hypothetical protein
MYKEKIKVIELSSENGSERKKINIICPKNEDLMGKAHSYYTRDEVKIAKLNYKLKNN